MKLEDFLREKHAKEYVGTDDDMPDDYDDWLAGREPENWFTMGENYCLFRILEIKKSLKGQTNE